MSRPLVPALWVSRGSLESPWRRWGLVLRQPQSCYAARSVRPEAAPSAPRKLSGAVFFDCRFKKRRCDRKMSDYCCCGRQGDSRFSACKLQAWMLTVAWGGFQFFDPREDGAEGLVGQMLDLDRLRSAPTVVAASSIRYC